MKKEKITKLTSEQEAYCDTIVASFIEKGLCTNKANRVLAERYISEAYVIAELAPPKEFVWVNSVLEGVEKCFELEYGRPPRKGDAAEVNQYLSNAGYGQHDAPWIAFYKYLYDIGLTEEINDLLPLINLTDHCGWWFPFDNVCVCVEKLPHISTDEQGNLHNVSQMAFKYADGFGGYYLNGVAVPEKYITKPVDPEELLREPNAEVRMAVIQKEGFDKIIDKLDAKVVDEDGGNALYDVLLSSIGEIRLLKLSWDDMFSTRKRTFLPVPRTKEEFLAVSGTCPTDINNVEQVRLWTMHCESDDMILEET